MTSPDTRIAFPDEETLRHIRKPLAHDSAHKHVQGSAIYIDDMPEPEGTLHIALGGSPVARGSLKSLDLSAVRTAPGVIAVYSATDIPGTNDVSPAMGDDPMFAEHHVEFVGQVLFAVVAKTRDEARRAVRLVQSDIAPETPSVSVDDAIERNETVLPDYAYGRGDVYTAVALSG
jgi:xanthine dehydrogenase large subunit